MPPKDYEKEILAAVGALLIDKLKGHDEAAYAVFDELSPNFVNKPYPYLKVLTHTVLQHVLEESRDARHREKFDPENPKHLRTLPSLFEKQP